MKRRTAIWADQIMFEVRGEGAKNFLSKAARTGVHLSRVSCTEKGYTGYAAGADLQRLTMAAKETKSDLHIRCRRGPGKWLERSAARPGLIAGVTVFFLLRWYLSGFVWTIDFGEMDMARQSEFREALAKQAIWEGCRMEEKRLREAEEAIELEMQGAGWVSLNFTSGCLFVEENEREIQEIRQTTDPQALYAKASGQVLSIELEGGFAEVVAGQYVSEGQLLANGQKADRQGEAVIQGATGTIRGRMRKTYMAEQALHTENLVLTGESCTMEGWQILGQVWEKSEVPSWQEPESVTEWLPLRIGRLSLPGSLRRITLWEKEAQPIEYSEKTAEAMAARSCRLDLLQEFPDAELETETLTFETDGQTVRCSAEYVFCAEMTKVGPLAPLEKTQTTS